MGFASITVDFGDGLGALKKRAELGLRVIGDRIADDMIRGPGGVSHQFDRQAELKEKGGGDPWRQSVRAANHPRLGGSRLTLVDEGNYRAAFEGKSSAHIRVISKNSVRIGVNPRRHPQVTLFQGFRVIGGVVPRRVGVSKGMIERTGERWIQYIVTGRRR